MTPTERRTGHGSPPGVSRGRADTVIRACCSPGGSTGRWNRGSCLAPRRARGTTRTRLPFPSVGPALLWADCPRRWTRACCPPWTALFSTAFPSATISCRWASGQRSQRVLTVWHCVTPACARGLRARRLDSMCSLSSVVEVGQEFADLPVEVVAERSDALEVPSLGVGSRQVSTWECAGRSRSGLRAVTTSACATSSGVTGCGTWSLRSIPRSASDARTVASTLSPGFVPADSTRTVSPARAAARPAASWERPASCAQTNSTVRRTFASAWFRVVFTSVNIETCRCSAKS